MLKTTDPNLRSFVEVDPASHFPIQNLPYGVCQPRGGGADPHVCVAIGEFVLDLAVLEERGLLRVAGAKERIFNRPSLNRFMALGSAVWNAARECITELLSAETPTLRDDDELRAAALIRADQVELLLPVEIGDYTDFYSSRYHATNVGTMIRGPENALQENWLHIPTAYHGRASSVVVSGRDIRRPVGQTSQDTFGPTRALDFELEMGFFVGPGNMLGEPIPIERAAEQIFGMVLVNDWSARDIQKWEYVPLGPFLSKSFATSISPWVVPLAALEPFRTDSPTQDPAPLPYLQLDGPWGFDIQLEVALEGIDVERPQTIARSNFSHLYWTICQQLTHHASNGCNLRPGDLLASGTISGPTKESRGCLLELTWGGREPLEMGSTRRTFLQDGDRVTMTGWCQGSGYRIGFGEVTTKILESVL